MEKYLSILQASTLFRGIDKESILSIMNCMNGTIHTFKKGEIIDYNGDFLTNIYFILEGEISIINEDFWGHSNLVSQFGVGQIFGESYASIENMPLNISIIASKDTKLLFMNFSNLLNRCSSTCACHNLLINNLFICYSMKNIQLTEKINHLSKRTTKEKILSYLSSQASLHGSKEFDIPLDRQQLADYLFIDRSAMSDALSKLKDEGLISYKKSHFILID